MTRALALLLSLVAPFAHAVQEVRGTTPGGAAYVMAVPDGWQPGGKLVFVNHGFNFELDDDPGLGPLRDVQLAEGYAVVASGFRERGWALFHALEDNAELLAAFRARLKDIGTAINLTGEDRRWGGEGGTPGVVRFFAPYPYRSPFYASTPKEECDRAIEAGIIDASGRFETVRASSGILGHRLTVTVPKAANRSLETLSDIYGGSVASPLIGPGVRSATSVSWTIETSELYWLIKAVYEFTCRWQDEMYAAVIFFELPKL